MLTIEGLHGDIVWWTQALDAVAEIRDDPVRYAAFQDALTETIPEAAEIDLPELLKKNLSLPQRLFLLAILRRLLGRGDVLK